LKLLAAEERTIILYESPHRLLKTLEQMTEHFELTREICVVREISKLFETYHRGQLQDQLNYFQQNAPKGEIVLIIKGID
jgi:16S rRNA (cytidine1402-2'-O)-methyltransferase